MNAATIKGLIAESKALIRQRTDNKGYNDQVLVRYWQDVPHEDLDACVAWLRDNGSSDNSSASSTVTNPIASARTHSGEWAVGPVEVLEIEEGGNLRKIIQQTLFRGSLTLSSVQVSNGCDELVERTFYFQVTTRPVLPSNGTGYFYVEGRMDIDPRTGQWIGWHEKHTAVNQTRTSTIDRADESSSIELNTHATSPLDEAVADEGKIVENENEPTRFCTTRTRKTTRTAKDQRGEATEERADQSSETETHTQAASEADGSAVEGKIVRAVSEPTEFGRFRTRKETITPKNQSNTDSEDRHDQSSVVFKNTQANNEVAAGTAAVGTIVRASNDETEFGKQRTRLETITAKDQQGEATEERADQSSETETHTQAASEADGSAVEGKIVRAVSEPTEFGRFRTRKETITPKFVSTGWIPYIDRYGTSYTIGFVNASESQLEAIKSAFTATTNNSLSAQKNGFGLFDGSASRIAIEDSGGGSSSDWSTGFDFIIPECARGSGFALAKAFVNFTTSTIMAQNFLNASKGYGTLVDYGAGDVTGIRFLGRGRYRVCRVEGKN